MLARLFTVLIWTLVAASATFWGFKLFTGVPAARPDVAAGSGSESNLPSSSDLVRLLGGSALGNTAAAQVQCQGLAQRCVELGIGGGVQLIA